MPLGETPTPTRGRLTIPDRGVSKTFMFNPPNMSDSKGVNYGSIQVPGASHPVYQYGSGGERIISFALYIDGDRGRFGREETGRQTLSIRNDLNFYRSLTYPSEFNTLGFDAVYPPIVLFNFGPMFNNVPCIVKVANYVVNYWTPELEPVRGTVNITLGEQIDESQTADDVTGIARGTNNSPVTQPGDN